MKDKQRDRKKDRRERKKERKMRQDSDRQWNLIHVHYSKHYIYKYMLYTYQQVFHLIENDEAYFNRSNLQGKRGGKREWKTDREKEWKTEREKERKKERLLRQDSDKGGN